MDFRIFADPARRSEYMRRETLRVARRDVAQNGPKAYSGCLELVLEADYVAALNENIDRDICAAIGADWPPSGWKGMGD